MGPPLLPWATALALLSAIGAADRALGPLDCYRNSGLQMGVDQVRCAPSLPSSATFCLKADVYDGRVVRECASAAQCPQGEGCAPISYEEDGTTDFVCCCSTDLCNAAAPTVALASLPVLGTCVAVLLARLGTRLTI